MTSPRFQFTISGLLWAIFWMAVGMAAWSLNIQLYYDYATPWFVLVFLRLLSPFLAVGALFRKTIFGLIVGAAIYAILFGSFLFAMHFDLIPYPY